MFRTGFLAHSLKQSIRERRTAETMLAYIRAPVPKNWGRSRGVMITKRNCFIICPNACRLAKLGKSNHQHTTDQAIVSTNQNDMSDVEYLHPRTHEKSDTRILLHGTARGIHCVLQTNSLVYCGCKERCTGAMSSIKFTMKKRV